MYIPDIFKVEDKDAIEKFIRDTGLATLISKGSTFPLATHIPLELQTLANGNKVLWGHISKANLQGIDIQTHPEVLAIFLSPLQGYISSSWYFHENAPTWNYMSVHISGKVALMDENTLWQSVSQLTDRYEKESSHPVSLQKFSDETRRQMKYITGIEIQIEKIEAAFKMSQNRDSRDFENILQKLRERNDSLSGLLADAMELQRAKNL